MSKVVKELVRQELVKRFDGMTSLAVVGFTGVDAVATSEIRKRLVSKGIRLTVIKNALAKQAFETVGLEVAVGLLDGPSAIATSDDSVIEIIRELLEIGRETPELTVKAAVLEGDAFGPERIRELSGYPTRDEAISRLVGCVMWPGARLGGCLVGPGRKVAALVKAIEEKHPDDQVQDEGRQQAEDLPSGSPAPPEDAAAQEPPEDAAAQEK